MSEYDWDEQCGWDDGDDIEERCPSRVLVGGRWLPCELPIDHDGPHGGEGMGSGIVGP